MRSCNHALGEKMAGRFGWAVREWFKYKNKLGDRMIKQLSNSVIAKYCDFSMSRRSIICLSLRLRQIIDLLATDKSQYFAQPRPIIVNYLLRTEIPKSHLNNHICQHYGMKTSTVAPSFYYVSNISLYCNDTMPSFIGNLWRVLLPGNHLKMQIVIKLEPVSLSNKKWTSTLAQDWLFWRKNATENA